MGKLHKLRRAIERAPNAWMLADRDGPYARPAAEASARTRGATGARFIPSRPTIFIAKRYRGFVRRVLRERGIPAR